MSIDKIPDGRYTITFDVKEGRVVNTETTPDAWHLLNWLILALALSLGNLIAMCFKNVKQGGSIIVYPDALEYTVEDLLQELLVKSRHWGYHYSPSVYLMKTYRRAGWFKIGQSKHPKRRADQLHAHLIHTVPSFVHDPEEQEILLLNFFAFMGRERDGEWFKLTDADVEFIKSLQTVDDIREQLEPFSTFTVSFRQYTPKTWWEHHLHELPAYVHNEINVLRARPFAPGEMGQDR